MLNRKSLGASLVIVLLLSAISVGALSFKTDPYMKSTRTQLMKARAHLFAGEADKGGHRAQAIAYTSQAIDEVTAGMKSNHHHHAVPQTVEIFATTPLAEAAAAGSHMRKALSHLKQARENLGAAAADPGGHRAKAFELIDKAIVEVEKANALLG